MTNCRIFNMQTHAQPFQQAIETLVQWASEPTHPRYVSACTVFGLMRGQEDEAILKAFNSADMVIADGMPIVWFQRYLGHRNAERVYGPDVLWQICRATEHLPIRHLFWGGTDGVAEQLAHKLQTEFPSLQIAGTHSPPIAPLESTPHPQVIEQINQFNADIVWVGLGSPKQDLWMHLYRPYLNAPVLIGVGAAFDFLSGNKRQAPVFMRRAGLEWLFRLVQEPRRLWRRYLIYNTLFVWHFIRFNLRHAR